jgi:hypothetical protein
VPTEAAAPSDPFVGTWQCVTNTTTMETAPVMNTSTSITMASVTITDNGSGAVTVVRTPEGDGAAPPCTEHFTLGDAGMTLTANPNQTCQLPTATLMQTITSGTFTIGSNGTTYTTHVVESQSGTTSAGKPYQATATSMSTCTKT